MRVPDPAVFVGTGRAAPEDDVADLVRDILASGIGETLCPSVSPLVDHLLDHCEAPSGRTR